jgi:hypothetical protein
MTPTDKVCMECANSKRVELSNSCTYPCQLGYDVYMSCQVAKAIDYFKPKEPLDKLIEGVRNLTELPKEDKMICNRCVKQDVCRHKELTERQEKEFSDHSNIELDCKFREPATDAQMNKIKERTEYALPTA